MTPRERAIAALRRQQPQGKVPHLELEFQLSEQIFGFPALRNDMLKDVSGARRQDMLKRNVEHWIKVAERFDWNVITGLHWLNREDQAKSFEYVREQSGDTYMLSAFVDGTWSIPNGQEMTDHVVYLTEREEEALEHAQRNCDHGIAAGVELIQAGAEIVFMCADYCFNDGPFLSPRMFAKHVTPFLRQLVQAYQKAGAFACKHTDGAIMPILDQLASTGIDALHSLDPMAGTDIKAVKAAIGDRVTLIGNVNLAWVQAGTKEQIEQSARYCMEHGGVRQGGYIYATSNCIFQGVPLENYEFMLSLRDKLGYPEAWQ